MVKHNNPPQWRVLSAGGMNNTQPTEVVAPQYLNPSQSPSDLIGIGGSFASTPNLDAHVVSPERRCVTPSFPDPAAPSLPSSFPNTVQTPDERWLNSDNWPPRMHSDDFSNLYSKVNCSDVTSSTAPSWNGEATNVDGQRNTRSTPHTGPGRIQSKNKKNNVELPDWFWAHDPEKYLQYQFACSYAYSDFNEFKRNSLEMHRRRGNIEREGISDEQLKRAYEVKPQERFSLLTEKYKEQWRLVRQELFGTDVSQPIPECNQSHKPYKPRRSVREKKAKARKSGETRPKTGSTVSAPESTPATDHDSGFVTANSWTPPSVPHDQSYSVSDPPNTPPYLSGRSKTLLLHGYPNTTLQKRFEKVALLFSCLERNAGITQRSDLLLELETFVRESENGLNRIAKKVHNGTPSSTSFPQQLPQQQQQQHQQPPWYTENNLMYEQDTSTTAIYSIGHSTSGVMDSQVFPPRQSGPSHAHNSHWSSQRTFGTP